MTDGSSRSPLGQRHDDDLDLEVWVKRVVRTILSDGARMTPNRPIDVTARLIAYFAARPERVFELELYEERGVDAGVGGKLHNAKH